MRHQATLFLDDKLRRSAANGRHNFIGHLIAVLRENGYFVDLMPESCMFGNGMVRAITHRTPPPPGGLTFRRVYHYPFWAIETTPENWERPVARSPFQAETVSKSEAGRLYDRWRRRLFPQSTANPTRDGFVYVPLQGRLLQHQPFQSCSPVEMLFHTLRAEPERDVIATLHPEKTLTDAEKDALAALADRNPRLTIRTANMEDMLRRCDYIVTMTSAAAFNGYFFGKPSILFGRVDFHHIALKASPDDLSAFTGVADHHPDYARYLAWFWQKHSINAGRPDVRAQIADALNRCGWPLSRARIS